MRSAYASSTWILHDVSGGVCGVGAFESLVFIGTPCWLVMSAECNYLYLFSLRFCAGVAIFRKSIFCKFARGSVADA